MCLEVLKYDPQNIKALFKSAECEFELGNYVESANHLSQCEADLRDEPKFVELQKKLADLKAGNNADPVSSEHQKTEEVPAPTKEESPLEEEAGEEVSVNATPKNISKPAQFAGQATATNIEQKPQAPEEAPTADSRTGHREEANRETLNEPSASPKQAPPASKPEPNTAQTPEHATTKPPGQPQESAPREAAQSPPRPADETPRETEASHPPAQTEPELQPQAQEPSGSPEQTHKPEEPADAQATQKPAGASQQPPSDIDEQQLKENLQKGPIYWLFLFLNYWQLLVGILIGYCLARIV